MKRTAKKIRFKPHESATAGRCEVCQRARGAHWHHWLPQEQIRVYVRGLRLPEDEADALLIRLIHDRRNLARVCLDCHGIGTLHGHNFTRADVPLSAFTFANELGQEWVARLHGEYARRGVAIA